MVVFFFSFFPDSFLLCPDMLDFFVGGFSCFPMCTCFRLVTMTSLKDLLTPNNSLQCSVFCLV